MVLDFMNREMRKDVFVPNRTILENLYINDIPLGQVLVFVNNQLISDEKFGEYLLLEDDEVIFKIIPAGDAEDIFKTILAVAVGGFVANALFGNVVGIGGEVLRSATTYFVSSKVSQKLISPPNPVGNSDSLDPRNPGISATRNKTNPFGVVPTLLGKMKIYPYKIGEFTELVGKDLYLNTLFCLGYGRIDISEVKIGETDIDSFNDVTFTLVEEKDSDTSFNYFNKDVFEETVGTQITDSAYVERTTQTNTNQISIDIEFPEGLVTFANDGSKSARVAEFFLDYKKSSDATWIPFQNSVNLQLSEGVTALDAEVTSWGSDQINVIVDSEDSTRAYITNNYDSWLQYPPFLTGDTITLSGSSAGNDGEYTVLNSRYPIPGQGFAKNTNGIYVQKSSGTVSSESGQNITFSKTVSQTPYFRISDISSSATRKNIKFTPGEVDQYDIRIKRKNAESTDSLIKDKANLATLRSIEQTGTDIAPNGLAYIELRIKATDQLNGTIDELNCIAESYLPVYDSGTETWTDTLIDQTSDSNLVWAYLQILRGAGNKKPVEDSRIDFDTFSEWDTYCTNKEFNYNGYIDSERSVVEILADIAAAGRANPMIKDGLQSVALDSEQDYPLQMFNERNTRNFKANRSLEKEIEGFKVKFINADKDYRRDEFFCPDTVTEDDNIEEMSLPGVTGYDQAYKIAYYNYVAKLLRPIVYTFDTDIQYLLSNKGDRIAYNYDVLNPGSKPRRITSVNTSGTSITAITIDDNFSMSAGTSYAVQYRTDDVADLKVRTEAIDTVAGDNTTLTFSTAIPDTSPQPSVGDMILVGESTAVSRDLIITEIAPHTDGAEIKCLDYSADIYDVDDPGFVVPDFTSKITFPTKQELGIPDNPSLTNVISDERALIFGAGGSLISRIIFQIGYSGQVEVDSFQVQYRLSGATSQYENIIVPADERQGVVSPVTDLETYEIRVRAVTRAGQASDWVSVTETVTGKTNSPSDVTDFSVVVKRDNFEFSWTKNTELDIAGYEIRKGASWDAGSVVGFFDVNKVALNEGVSGTGTVMFWIKAIDTTGNYSDTASMDSIVVQAPATPVILPVVVQNEVTLDWQDCKTTFPIQRSIIKKSLDTETIAEATTLNSNAPESFYSFTESVGGDFKYYIQVEDTAENLSAIATIDTTVGNPPNLKFYKSFEDIDFDGTKTNCIVDTDGDLLFNIDTTETWQEHYSINSWGSESAKISDGYSIYAQPALTTGTYSVSYSLSSSINTGKVITSADIENIVGSPSIDFTIGLSNDNVTWTNYAASAVFATIPFQYVNITVSVTCDPDTELLKMSKLKSNVQLNQKDDSSIEAISVTSQGQTISFTETFRRVYDVNINVNETSQYTTQAAGYTADNPTDFDIYIWDKDGNTFGDAGFPASIDVTWTARGATDL